MSLSELIHGIKALSSKKRMQGLFIGRTNSRIDPFFLPNTLHAGYQAIHSGLALAPGLELQAVLASPT